MFNKKFICVLVFVILFSFYIPVFATDSVFVWSQGVIDTAVSNSSVIRWKRWKFFKFNLWWCCFNGTIYWHSFV